MGLLAIIGISLIAEQIGERVQSIARESNEAEIQIAKEKRRSDKELAKIQAKAEREKELIKAEAKLKAEKIRTAGELISAKMISDRNHYSSSAIMDDIDYISRRGSLAYTDNQEWERNSIGANRSLPLGNSEMRFCPMCGRPAPAGTFFCRNCGSKL